MCTPGIMQFFRSMGQQNPALAGVGGGAPLGAGAPAATPGGVGGMMPDTPMAPPPAGAPARAPGGGGGRPAAPRGGDGGRYVSPLATAQLPSLTDLVQGQMGGNAAAAQAYPSPRFGTLASPPAPQPATPLPPGGGMTSSFLAQPARQPPRVQATWMGFKLPMEGRIPAPSLAMPDMVVGPDGRIQQANLIQAAPPAGVMPGEIPELVRRGQPAPNWGDANLGGGNLSLSQMISGV